MKKDFISWNVEIGHPFRCFSVHGYQTHNLFVPNTYKTQTIPSTTMDLSKLLPLLSERDIRRYAYCYKRDLAMMDDDDAESNNGESEAPASETTLSFPCLLSDHVVGEYAYCHKRDLAMKKVTTESHDDDLEAAMDTTVVLEDQTHKPRYPQRKPPVDYKKILDVVGGEDVSIPEVGDDCKGSDNHESGDEYNDTDHSDIDTELDDNLAGGMESLSREDKEVLMM